MKMTAIRTNLFHPGDPLASFIFQAIPTVTDGTVIAIASKIVALSQGRTAPNNPETKKKLVASEAERVVATPWCDLTLKDGHWCPNAGIDESNGNSELVLWPEKPFEVAHDLWLRAREHYDVERIGIVITDSRIFPLRAGVTGVALGYAGFNGLRDYRGKPDLFGRPMTMSQTNVADSLATAATLVCGEGAEQTPLAVITDAPVEWTDAVSPDELRMDPKFDLFGPLFNS